MPSRSIHQWLDAYAEHHQNPTNKLVHWVCVPLILFSVVGLLASIPVGQLPEVFPAALRTFAHVGTLVIIAALVFYARLSLPIALGMAAVGFAALLVVAMVARSGLGLWQTSVAVFVVAWIGQFVGHKIEGAKPSFFDDVQFLLIGPAWLLGFVFRAAGVKY